MTARILIIAGSDSGGGAGIQADIKTVTMLGGYAMTAITAITAQNTLGVNAILAVPPEIITAQIDAVVSDLGVDAIKIGMLGTRETIACVEAALARLPQDIPVVVDPVLVATSGASLSEADTIPALHGLFSRATLVTPNLPELEALGGEAAVLIHGCALLVKGGHAEGERLTDRLVTAAGTVAEWEDSRIATRHTHGTGCTLASAIATGLGEGLPLEQAIARARKFVRAALRAAPGFGAGHGPMGHQSVRLNA